MWEGWLSDLGHGVRLARKHPGFTTVAVVMLAIGIGANTALFSLARAILLQSLPVDEPQRVVRLFGTTNGAGLGTFSYPNFEDLKASSRSFEHLAVHRQLPVQLGEGDGARSMAAELVSPDYFSVFGIEPRLGRPLGLQDFDGSEGAVVVIGHRLWWQDLGGREDVLGLEVEINRRRYTVVGVMPASFSGAYPAFRTEAWVPVIWHEQLRPLGIPYTSRGWGWLFGTGRLAKGVTLEKARVEVETVGRRLERDHPDANADQSFTLLEASPLPEGMRGDSERLLSGLALIVTLVLLAACANVGGVLVGRTLERQRELSLRSSIGASRWQLIRLLLAEAVTVAFFGATVGLGVAAATRQALIEVLSSAEGFESFDPSGALDLSAVAFAYALALTCALLFGLLPALKAAAGGAVAGLRNDPSLAGGVRLRSWSALVVAQVAIAVVLLVGAGLLLHSVWRTEAFDPGFRTENIALASVNLRGYGYSDTEGTAFLQEVRERLSALPGVSAVSWAAAVPLAGGRDRMGFRIPGQAGADGAPTVSIDVAAIGPDYFRTIDIPLLAGRGFGVEDFASEHPRAVVVNRTFADHFFSDVEAVGATLGVGATGPAVPIVGVVADSRFGSLDEEPRPFLYFPRGGVSATFFVAAEGDATTLLRPIREAIESRDARVLPQRLLTFAEGRRDSLFLQRALGTTTTLLALLAVSLTALGIYGAVSHGVTRRQKELGLRMALGAQPANVVSLVLTRAAWLLSIGLLLGTLGSLLLGRALSGLFFGISPFEPLTHGAAVLAIAVAVAAASFIPARRAVRLDPRQALIQE